MVERSTKKDMDMDKKGETMAYPNQGLFQNVATLKVAR